MNLATTSFKGSLKVIDISDINPLIRKIRLQAPSGGSLPTWMPGAHLLVQVQLPDGGSDWRHYSLIDFDGVVSQPSEEVHEYTIAIRLEEDGRGGSRFMHSLEVGDYLSVEGPKNNFMLHIPRGTTRLLAGGIGITPLCSMASYCHANGHNVELYYSGRSRELLAFAEELGNFLKENLHIHADDENNGNFFNVETLLDKCTNEDYLYVCGPRPMLDAVLKSEENRGLEPGHVIFEIFDDENAIQEGDHAFEIELAESGEIFEVGPDQTILDCLIENDYDPLYDCTRGECGVCSIGVLEGEIDHRDYYLTHEEKDAGDIMQVCVSRAKGKKLVLDM